MLHLPQLHLSKTELMILLPEKGNLKKQTSTAPQLLFPLSRTDIFIEPVYQARNPRMLFTTLIQPLLPHWLPHAADAPSAVSDSACPLQFHSHSLRAGIFVRNQDMYNDLAAYDVPQLQIFVHGTGQRFAVINQKKNKVY